MRCCDVADKTRVCQYKIPNVIVIIIIGCKNETDK